MRYLILAALAMLLSGYSKPKSVEIKKELSISKAQELFKSKELSIPELVQYYLTRIQEIDQSGPKLNSIISINPEALQIAEDMQSKLDKGMPLGPLHGIPVILKDNIDTADKMPCTAGSLALANSFPEQDSWLARQLKASGAIIIAKANLSEWANFRAHVSSSGWSAIGGQTKNPYVLDRNPCGSSSGSGAATAADLCILAFGTETNGSIVCPSNNNGLVGLKPTVGLISRSGIIPVSHSHDTAGPMCRSVEDVALVLGSITLPDPNDETTQIPGRIAQRDYSGCLNKKGLKGKRIGWWSKSGTYHSKVDQLLQKAIRDLKAQGAKIIEIEEEYDSKMMSASMTVMYYEVKYGLDKYLGKLPQKTTVRSLEDLIAFNKSHDEELKFFDQKHLEHAVTLEGLDNEKYLEALETMHRLSREEGIDKFMEKYRLDAIVTPTGSPAWKTDMINGDHYLGGSSSPAAISGYPSITLPMGFVEELPVGISFTGRAWTEALLLEMAYAYEQATQHRRSPKFLKTLVH